jgi:hypothetical protein
MAQQHSHRLNGIAAVEVAPVSPADPAQRTRRIAVAARMMKAPGFALGPGGSSTSELSHVGFAARPLSRARPSRASTSTLPRLVD